MKAKPSYSRFSTALRTSVGLALTTGCFVIQLGRAADVGNSQPPPRITTIDPPEQDFFSKRLDFHGIPIKSHVVVVDEALYAAYDRLARLFDNLLTKQPLAISNLVAAGAALHIIGRDQVTTDLPEWRHDKHVPLDEYNGLTRDQRTRGMGGRLTSCGEENLLQLPNDRYRGRDICLHEFSHSVLNNGCQREIKTLFAQQRQKSLDKGLWVGSYAGSNADEFFAELTMWYFGTRGDLSMSGPKPEPGPEGLKEYDPEAYTLMDDFYSGRIEITERQPRFRAPADAAIGSPTRQPRDSQAARSLVARLNSYQIGQTKIEDFFADTGMTKPEDEGKDAWLVSQRDIASTESNNGTTTEHEVPQRFHVSFRSPNANRNPSIADLEFKSGVLAALVWNN